MQFLYEATQFCPGLSSNQNRYEALCSTISYCFYLQIVDEFLSPCNTLPEPNEICMMVPNYKDVYGVLYEKLNFSQADAAKFLIPWTVTMAVHGILPDISVEPLE